MPPGQAVAELDRILPEVLDDSSGSVVRTQAALRPALRLAPVLHFPPMPALLLRTLLFPLGHLVISLFCPPLQLTFLLWLSRLPPPHILGSLSWCPVSLSVTGLSQMAEWNF